MHFWDGLNMSAIHVWICLQAGVRSCPSMKRASATTLCFCKTTIHIRWWEHVHTSNIATNKLTCYWLTTRQTDIDQLCIPWPHESVQSRPNDDITTVQPSRILLVAGGGFFSQFSGLVVQQLEPADDWGCMWQGRGVCVVWEWAVLLARLKSSKCS